LDPDPRPLSTAKLPPPHRRSWRPWASIAIPAVLLFVSAWFSANGLHEVRTSAEGLARSRAGITEVSGLRIALLDAVQSFRVSHAESPADQVDSDEAIEQVRTRIGRLHPRDDDSPLMRSELTRLGEAIEACLVMLDYRRIAFLVRDDAALNDLIAQEADTLRPALAALEEIEMSQRWIGERREQDLAHENDELRIGLTLTAFFGVLLQLWIWLVIRHDRRQRVRVETGLRETNQKLEVRVAERTATLAQTNRELAALSSRLLQVQEQERRSLALELHDQIGQQLAALLLNLRVMEGHIAKEGDNDTASRIRDCTEIVETTYEQIHDLALELRPSLLDRMGLVPTIEWYARHQETRAGCRILVRADALPQPMTAEIATASFRIVQEAVNNALKHGNPAEIVITVRRLERQFELTIKDNGKGFDPAAVPASGGCGLGLLGMRERATLAGGTLTISSRPGEGTEVKAKLPILLQTTTAVSAGS